MIRRLIGWLAEGYRSWLDLCVREGIVFYAPPLVISASSPLWRASALPLRALPAPDPLAATAAVRTDPYVVAQRRASFRLVPTFSEPQGLT